jgi:hypothetical protein
MNEEKERERENESLKKDRYQNIIVYERAKMDKNVLVMCGLLD